MAVATIESDRRKAMRLVHLSDIHFGRYGHGWDPNEDQRRELLNDLGRFVDEKGPVDGGLSVATSPTTGAKKSTK
jgi:hypothetical protein